MNFLLLAIFPKLGTAMRFYILVEMAKRIMIL